jgi:hypothetical protein
MADLGNVFDPNEVPEDDRNFEPLPAGEYVCQVIESDLEELKSGKGDALKLTIEVIEGPHANRRLWDRLNIRHDNATAQSIAQRALADLCQAVGVGAIRDSEELHYKSFVARIAIETDKSGQYEPRNTVKRYKARAGKPPAAKAAQPQRSAAAQRAAASSTGARPWSRSSAPQRPEIDDDIPF